MGSCSGGNHSLVNWAQSLNPVDSSLHFALHLARWLGGVGEPAWRNCLLCDGLLHEYLSLSFCLPLICLGVGPVGQDLVSEHAVWWAKIPGKSPFVT